MPRKRYSTAQIVTKLRQAEVELGRGLRTPQVCKKLGISEQTYYRWRKEYGGRASGPGQAVEGTQAREPAAEGPQDAILFDQIGQGCLLMLGHPARRSSHEDVQGKSCHRTPSLLHEAQPHATAAEFSDSTT